MTDGIRLSNGKSKDYDLKNTVIGKTVLCCGVV
jgi:hypothetical protein